VRRADITHVRMHNYGEAFADRQLVEKVRYAKSDGHPRSRADQQRLADHRASVARGMVEAGLDAINISVDAAGKESSSRRGSASTTTRSSPTSSG
jgi:MoaA/NifB/PqqE/SkfB family radical SAM enzyme